jgi:hypothetical protein
LSERFVVIRWRALVLTALALGPRQGEALTLR